MTDKLWEVWADGNRVGTYLTYEGAEGTLKMLAEKRRMITEKGKVRYERRHTALWLKSVLPARSKTTANREREAA